MSRLARKMDGTFLTSYPVPRLCLQLVSFWNIYSTSLWEHTLSPLGCNLVMLVTDIFSISFPNERLGIRLLGNSSTKMPFNLNSLYLYYWVYGLLVLDIVQTIFSTHWVWRILVLGWGDTSVLSQLPWSSITIPILSGIGIVAVQLVSSKCAYLSVQYPR